MSIANGTHVEFGGSLTGPNQGNYQLLGELRSGGTWVFNTPGTVTLNNTLSGPAAAPVPIPNNWSGLAFVLRGTLASAAGAVNQLGDSMSVILLGQSGRLRLRHVSVPFEPH